MIRNVAVVLVMLLGVSCANDDGSGATCSAPGTATVTGSVMGVEVAPVMRAYQSELFTGVFGIVMDEELGAACDSVSTTGEHLALLFCALPEEKTYNVVGDTSFDCPNDNVFGILERGGGMDVAKATSGTATVTGASAGCAIGTFSIDFGGESLSGTFNAVVCP
jgi:hypothetical protein